MVQEDHKLAYNLGLGGFQGYQDAEDSPSDPPLPNSIRTNIFLIIRCKVDTCRQSKDADGILRLSQNMPLPAKKIH